MEFTFQYEDIEDRNLIINSNTDKYLIAEKNIKEGNFLVFSTVKTISVEVEELKQENTLLRARNNALTERADFIEDIIAEMAIQVYQ